MIHRSLSIKQLIEQKAIPPMNEMIEGRRKHTRQMLERIRGGSFTPRPIVNDAPMTVNPPYPMSWKEIHPDSATMEWYGPDEATGRVGGKLVSNSQGDRLAFQDLGVIFTADHDGLVEAAVEVQVASGHGEVAIYGIGQTHAALVMAIDAYTTPPQYGYAYQRLPLWDSAPSPHGYPGSLSCDPGLYRVAVAFQAQAGISYGLWGVVEMFATTWGLNRAETDLDATITSIIYRAE